MINDARNRYLQEIFILQFYESLLVVEVKWKNLNYMIIFDSEKRNFDFLIFLFFSIELYFIIYSILNL